MELRLNLASRVYLDRRSVRRWLLLIGTLLCGLLAVNLLYGYRNWQQLQLVDMHLGEVAARLAAQRGHQPVTYSPERFTRVMTRVDSANQILAADRFRWTELLGRLEELTPVGVAIRSLQPDFKNRKLQITAVARDVPAMNTLLDALLASDDKRQVYLLNQGWAELSEEETVLQFSLVIQEAF